MLHLVSFAVGIGNSETYRFDPVNLVVDQDHLLRRQVGDGIDPLWIGGMIFRDGKDGASTIFSPRPRVDNLGLSIIFTTGLKEDQGPPTVYVQVLQGVSHTLHVIDLPGEMKDIVLLPDQVVHGTLVSDIAEIHMDLIGYRLNVEEIASLARHHVIHQGHLRPELYELYRQIAADKAESPRDEDLLSFKLLAVVHRPLLTPFLFPIA